MRVPTELTGSRVTRTAFDHQVRLSFTGHEPDGRVRVDGELVVETRSCSRTPRVVRAR
ncbi:hypothetical protein ACP4TB_19735 [Streptomyces sp. DR3-1]|uniref:hypothetical protein n=1 Tax=Streptomyces sp. DR3-1 TaxID=2951169 RepID=UPI002042E2D6|nr:hypothetical protein [Streptomyces sp. DR3-1]MCM3820510.1 hypothetical protein [Streptomyces sp. DR3-1]